MCTSLRDTLPSIYTISPREAPSYHYLKSLSEVFPHSSVTMHLSSVPKIVLFASLMYVQGNALFVDLS